METWQVRAVPAIHLSHFINSEQGLKAELGKKNHLYKCEKDAGLL